MIPVVFPTIVFKIFKGAREPRKLLYSYSKIDNFTDPNLQQCNCKNNHNNNVNYFVDSTLGDEHKKR